MTVATLTAQPDFVKHDGLESSQSAKHASFNYYSRETRPELDDLSIINGTSPDITSRFLPVTDLRCLEQPLSSYRHETHGFQFLHQPLPIEASHSSVHNAHTMNSQYYPSMVSLLKEKLNVRSAVIINHTLRDIPSTEDHYVDPKNPRPTGKSLAPFFIAHSDYTPAAARAHFRAMTADWFKETNTEVGTTQESRDEFLRLREEIISAEDAAIEEAGLGKDSAENTSGKGRHWDWDGKGYEGPRYAMFSIWRPWETVQRDPLAVMDTRGLELQYVPLPRLYKNRPGCVKEYYNENVLVKPPEKGDTSLHKWCYVSEQKAEEVLAIKFYDSEVLRKGTGAPLMCPHSAFHAEDMDDKPVRRSCELRVWCIW
ncbi:GA4 desaturase [Pestalotiopsis sp. NC0098]|nr:GA4 desaturase [Pestalotiopsis sp. NC0098]